MTQTTSMKIDSNADVVFTGRFLQGIGGKKMVNHAEYANSIHLVKDKLSLRIEDVEDLQVRIEKLEEIFSYLRNRKLKQKEVIFGTDDETSSKDDTSSNDEISSSEDSINYLSARDVEWQLPKNTQEEPPKPHYDPIKTEVEEPLRLDIMYPHSHVASRVMGTNKTGKAHYRLRSLGPLKEEMVYVKKPYNMVKVTNVKTVNEDARLQALVDGKKIIVNEASIRRDLRLDNVEGLWEHEEGRKRFSRAVTPLFKTMMVEAHEDIGEGSKILTNPHPTPIVTQPLSSRPQKKQKSRRKQRKETKVPQTEAQNDENVTTPSNDPLLIGEDRLQLNELMNLCTNLQKQVLDLEKAKTAQDGEIVSLKKRVKKLERRNKSRKLGIKRLRKVGTARRIESSEDEDLGDQEDASKHGRIIADIDAEEGVALVNETRERNDQYMFDTGVLDDKEFVAEKEVNTAGEVVTTVDVEVSTATTAATTPIISKDELTLAQTLIEIKAAKPKAVTTVATTTAPKAKVKEIIEGSSKRAGDELEQEDAKRQRIEEKNASTELKRCLEIVPDDEDDVTVESTPLSSKYPTIIDYKIYKEGRKSFFQIIRADGNSQMYLTISKMLKNFNREDLELLWSIVKSIFEKTKPVDNMDNLLFQTLKSMFKHHIKDTLWKYQQGLTKVLNLKLFDSCGVYCVTMQNMVYYLLVKKMYPFTKHTLQQLWNDVRLQVDYEVEMAYDLLRLIIKQLREGYIAE
uniref:Uncharacterized protein n=1 Tax=Tanacetum cinerariifolium TaxID=118510 RepID=A0A6L2L615_TANCI|nr:hypothetical protein [Tanacetum cinerariifolium]